MNQRLLFLIGFPALWIFLWGLIAAVSLGMRPLLPGVELDTLATAWDMWQRDAFLLPGLPDGQTDGDGSGRAYPLYFWLIHGSWALFGISDIWPRLLPPVLGLLNTVMIAALCRVLWPGWAGLGVLGGTMAMGMIGWLALSSFTGAELLFSLCILLAMTGLVSGWRRDTWDGFILLGFGLGLGFLAAGLSVLIPVLPVALLTPLWAPALGWSNKGTTGQDNSATIDGSGWRHWFMRLGFSLLIAIALILGWIVTVVIGVVNDEGMGAGLSLALRLVFGSTFNLFSDAMTGGRQWWLYLLTLCVFLFPWIIWPTAWRSVGGLWSLIKDGGGRFCLIWLLPPLVIYTILPGSRPLDVALHVPPLAMMASYLLYLRMDPEMARQGTERQFANGESVLGIVIALLGLALIMAPLSGGLVAIPWWVEGLNGAWGLVLLGVAAMAAYAAPRMVVFRATLVMVQMVLVVVIGILAASPLLMSQVNSEPPAAHLRHALDQDIDVAIVGASPFYRQAMDFPARLDQPLTRLDPEDSIGIVAWAAGHENGQIAVVMEQLLMGAKPVAVFPYMGQYIVFWPAETVAEQPGIAIGKDPSQAGSG